MKIFISYLLLFSCLNFGTPLYAATQTLITYYPAPNGNYNRMQTNSIKLTASTLSAIQAQYKCSFDPTAGLVPCPAGLMYFDTPTQTIFVATATHWSTLNATCVPVTACPVSNGCSSDSCGMGCGPGTCPVSKSCSSSTPGIPGTCV